MASNSALAIVASGLFSLLVAGISGVIAFQTARTNARGKLKEIQEQVDAQQAVLDRAKITELRQHYLTPLQYYARSLSHRLTQLETMLQSARKDEVRGWFKTVKDQVTRDKVRGDYEAWCYYTGVFAISTLYYTCSYFYCARSIRFNRPFGESMSAYSEKLEAHLVRVSDAFGDDEERGIWHTTQEVIGERFANNGLSLTYLEMCREHKADEEFRRALYFRPLDFWWEKVDAAMAREIRAALDDLVNFLGSTPADVPAAGEGRPGPPGAGRDENRAVAEGRVRDHRG